MKVLIIGGGGREHALAWKCAQSPLVDEVLCAPGNGGTATEPGVRNVDIAADDIVRLVDLAVNSSVGLSIVGPEAPLVAGVVDAFIEAGVKCFGPTSKAAVLEGSKSFAKEFLRRNGIPTAAYETFDDLKAATDYIDSQAAPLVVKADGLAAGKGVVVAKDHAEARAAVKSMLTDRKFGAAGARVIVEEFLNGEEASFICMTDGRTAIPFASSQDHKARDEGDSGPNTGGMGAYSPAPIIDSTMHTKIMQDVIEPTLTGMRNEGREYRGFLYAGVMIGSDGIPRVLEFNCRFGDPETQPIMMRLKTDLVASCLQVLDGEATFVTFEWDQRVALGVVLASGGYPGAYEKGQEIAGLRDIEDLQTYVFHAGTRLDAGRCVTDGGRVLCVVGLGENVSDAQATAYRRVAAIEWPGVFYRNDIGYRAIARETN